MKAVLIVLWFSLMNPGGYDRVETLYPDTMKCWTEAVSLLNKEPRVVDAFCRAADTNKEQATPKVEQPQEPPSVSDH